MKTLRDTAGYALDALKKAGADHAQCAVTSSVQDEFTIEGNELSLMRTLFESSLTIKAIKDMRPGVITINKHDRASIDEAVRACMASCDSAAPDESEGIAELTGNKSFRIGPQTRDVDGLFENIKTYLAEQKRAYPTVGSQLATTYRHVQSVFANSNGVLFEYDADGHTMQNLFISSENGKSASFSGYAALFESARTPLLELGMYRRLLEENVGSIHTRPVPEKFTGTVLISPACLGSLLLQALGVFVTDDVIIQGVSPWKDALGTAVASPLLSLRLAPLDPWAVFGERVTRDGYASENVELIERGVLKSFALSRYGAKKTGNARALNSSANLHVLAGDTPLADIIAGIPRGILLNRFSGGMPAANGDFSGVAKNSFLIEDGKITHPLSETMISGNFTELLRNARALSRETVCDGATLLPWAAFDGVIIK